VGGSRSKAPAADNGEELEWRVQQCVECILGTSSVGPDDELKAIQGALGAEVGGEGWL